MTTATQIQRFSKNIKLNLSNAAAKIELDGYTISADYMSISCDEDNDGGYEMMYFRNGDELIALPCFYLYEADGSIFTGSQGGEYELNGETLTLVD